MFEDAPSIWAAIVVGVGSLLLFWFSRLNYLAFEELRPLAAAPDPATDAAEPLEVTVVIPARNEARNIARAVKSFTPFCRVIVMDDDSTDGTAQKARAAGAEVFQAPPVRGKILGKPSACLAAFELVDTRWILFADADVECQPTLLPTLIDHARNGGLDMVSLFLGRRHTSFLSALLVPYAYAVYFTGVRASRVHSLKTKEAMACGQCLLFSANAYQFTGGHRTILNEVLDDMEIGRLAKRHRLKFQIMRAEKLGRARMYESLPDLWTGMRRATLRLLAYNQSLVALPVIATILPVFYFPVLAWLWTEREEEFVRQTIYAFATVPLWMVMPWYRNLFALAAPVTMHLFPFLALNASARWLLGLKDTWKGRTLNDNS